MRFLLVEAAQALLSAGTPTRRRRFVYLAMRRDRRIAKVAMARKLAVSLYWMWRKGFDYPQTLQVPVRTRESLFTSMRLK